MHIFSIHIDCIPDTDATTIVRKRITRTHEKKIATWSCVEIERESILKRKKRGTRLLSIVNWIVTEKLCGYGLCGVVTVAAALLILTFLCVSILTAKSARSKKKTTKRNRMKFRIHNVIDNNLFASTIYNFYQWFFFLSCEAHACFFFVISVSPVDVPADNANAFGSKLLQLCTHFQSLLILSVCVQCTLGAFFLSLHFLCAFFFSCSYGYGFASFIFQSHFELFTICCWRFWFSRLLRRTHRARFANRPIRLRRIQQIFHELFRWNQTIVAVFLLLLLVFGR